MKLSIFKNLIQYRPQNILNLNIIEFDYHAIDSMIHYKDKDLNIHYMGSFGIVSTMSYRRYFLKYDKITNSIKYFNDDTPHSEQV